MRSFALIALMLLFGCTSGGSEGRLNNAAPVESAQQALSLPAPSSLDLQPSRGTSLSDEDLTVTGSEFDPLLPSNLVSTAGSSLEFDPDSTLPRLEGVSYAIYRFNIPGFDRSPVVNSSWNALEQENVFTGLADWERDSWKWFSMSSLGRVNLGSIDPYLRGDGTLLIVIASVGDELSRLNSMQVGGMVPEPIITLEPAGGFAPLEIEAHGGFSQDDGNIIQYAWDLDDDGAFELSSADPNVPSPLSFTEAGEYKIRLRVTDNDTNQATSEVVIPVATGWAHSLGGEQADNFTAVACDGVAAIYACGSTNSFGAGSSDIWLASFDLNGNLLWARTWGTAGSESGLDLAIDSSGNVITLGITSNGENQTYLLRWSPAGTLLTSKHIQDPNHLFPTALDLLDDRAVVVGRRLESAGELLDRPCLLDYDLDTDTFRIRQWDFGGGILNIINDVEASPGLFPGFERYYCVGTAGNQAFLLECDAECDDIIAQALTGSESSRGFTVTLGTSILADPHVGGRLFSAGSSSLFVARWSFSEQFSTALQFDGIGTEPVGHLITPEGNHVLASSVFFDNGWIYSFDPVAAPLGLARIQGQSSSTHLEGLAMAGEAGVVMTGLSGNALNVELAGGSLTTVDVPLAWETISITDTSLNQLVVGDFTGTVGTAAGLHIDDDAVGSSDGLIMLKSLP